MQLSDLAGGTLDIGCVGVRHRLDGDRGAAADSDVAHPYADRFPTWFGSRKRHELPSQVVELVVL
jgi:hypothetical protein